MIKPVYGLTHELDGTPRIRTPRVIKIQIGNPIGKALHVYMDAAGKWALKIGVETKSNPAKVEKFKTREECEAAYRMAYQNAPLREYPSKLPYYTFSRVGPNMDLIPDFEVIEKHGPMPTMVPIVFTDDSPFDAAYEWWKAGRLVCRGNGMEAERSVESAVGLVQIEAAKAAKAEGQKTFLVTDGCYLNGCPFVGKDERGKDRGCKPKGQLSGQLALAPRLGGKAAIDTTSAKSIVNIFSALQELQRFTGYGDPEKGVLAGIGVMMTLRKWKHQQGHAYAIGLEFRDTDYGHMRKNLLGQAAEFRRLLGAPSEPSAAPLAIDAGAVVDAENPEDFEEAALDHATTAEFYPEEHGEGEESEQGEPEPESESESVRLASAQAQERLKEKLRAAAEKPVVVEKPAAAVEKPVVLDAVVVEAQPAADPAPPPATPAPAAPAAPKGKNWI